MLVAGLMASHTEHLRAAADFFRWLLKAPAALLQAAHRMVPGWAAAGCGGLRWALKVAKDLVSPKLVPCENFSGTTLKSIVRFCVELEGQGGSGSTCSFDHRGHLAV